MKCCGMLRGLRVERAAEKMKFLSSPKCLILLKKLRRKSLYKSSYVSGIAATSGGKLVQETCVIAARDCAVFLSTPRTKNILPYIQT